MKTRPYIVSTAAGNERIVEAANAAQALRHVARDVFDVKVASASQVIALMSSGVKPEIASTKEGDE